GAWESRRSSPRWRSRRGGAGASPRWPRCSSREPFVRIANGSWLHLSGGEAAVSEGPRLGDGNEQLANVVVAGGEGARGGVEGSEVGGRVVPKESEARELHHHAIADVG